MLETKRLQNKPVKKARGWRQPMSTSTK